MLLTKEEKDRFSCPSEEELDVLVQTCLENEKLRLFGGIKRDEINTTDTDSVATDQTGPSCACFFCLFEGTLTPQGMGAC